MPEIKMARPKIYYTEEERHQARKRAWQKYNDTHKEERAAHNKEYCQREDVKERRRKKKNECVKVV